MVMRFYDTVYSCHCIISINFRRYLKKKLTTTQIYITMACFSYKHKKKLKIQSPRSSVQNQGRIQWGCPPITTKIDWNNTMTWIHSIIEPHHHRVRLYVFLDCTCICHCFRHNFIFWIYAHKFMMREKLWSAK
jgi:hypothetical protein